MLRATRKRVIRECVNVIWSREIKSYEEFKRLEVGTDVAIMDNCEMVIGKVNYCIDQNYVFTNVDHIFVREDSFKNGNFMHQIII